MKCATLPKSMSEAAWRTMHQHGEIVSEPYPGVQPPTYKLAQLRCKKCGAVLIRMETKQTTETE